MERDKPFLQLEYNCIQIEEKEGFSLVEILVVIIIAMIVIGVIYKTLNNVYLSYKEASETVISNINTFIPLQIIERDLKLAGFGTPEVYDTTCTVPEENISEICEECLATNNTPPLPICICNGEGNSSDIIVIHSSIANINEHTRKIGVLYYDGKDSVFYSLSKENWTSNDVFIILSTDSGHKKLMCFNSQALFTISSFNSSDLPDWTRKTPYLIYGIGDATSLFPFNTVYYYLKRNNNPPKRCENLNYTYTLYRKSRDSTTGQPIMDCVLNLQAFYGFSTPTGGIAWNSTYSGRPIQMADNLKAVLVFIVYMEGKKAKYKVFNKNYINFKEPCSGNIIGTIELNDESYPNYKYYKWKVIRLLLKPNNLKPFYR